MRENNRKSIASIEKFPQFTTMNVIDGQAGLVFYSSLIFYSLTINNILNIIVLLILAAVTISALAGDNGILTQTKNAKIQNEKASIKEQIELAVLTSMMNDNLDANIDTSILETELNKITGVSIEKQGDGESLPWTVTASGFKFQIKEDGTVESVNGISLSQTSLKMVEGQEPVTITATLTEGIEGTITWRSSNESVATVNGGTITVVGTSGTAEITAEVSGTDYSAKCTVTIVSRVTAISVTDLTVEEGSSSQLVVTTTPNSNIEELTYLSDKEDIAKVDSTGKVTGVAEGTATITVSGKISTAVSKTCTVTVTKPKGLEIGDYVEYDVTYTDIWSDTDSETEGRQRYEFSKTDGWRVLNPGTKEDGKYTGVKLISTGIPALLHYDSATVKNFEKDASGTLGNWAGNSTDRNNYASAFHLSSSNDNENMYAAAGLYYNFGKILFTTTSDEVNTGGYIKVNNKTEGNLAEDEFVVSGKATEVHNLTFEELNKARGASASDEIYYSNVSTNDADTGLFCLVDLASENPDFGYSSSDNLGYWLTFITDDDSDPSCLMGVNRVRWLFRGRLQRRRGSSCSFSKV